MRPPYENPEEPGALAVVDIKESSSLETFLSHTRVDPRRGSDSKVKGLLKDEEESEDKFE